MAEPTYDTKHDPVLFKRDLEQQEYLQHGLWPVYLEYSREECITRADVEPMKANLCEDMRQGPDALTWVGRSY